MVPDAARRLILRDGGAAGVQSEEAGTLADGAWEETGENLRLILERSHFEAMLAEAARWADEITLCVTAPESQRGTLPWWGELLARSAKCVRIIVRRPEQAEGWLLHRLHDTGALRFTEPGGKQVASNLLLFARAEELRGLLAHIPLERATAGAAFGTLLAFRSGGSSDLARACRAQAESWSKLAAIPTGSEIDALVRAARRTELVPRPELGAAALRVITDPARLERGLRQLFPELVGDPESSEALRELALGGGWSMALSSAQSGSGTGHQLQFRHRDKSRPPFLLTLHPGAAWGAGNGLLLEAPDDRLVLAWRGGLLGPSRSKCDLLWAEARLHTLSLDVAELGLSERVAVVTAGGSTAPGAAADRVPELLAFVRETARLGAAFGVEPPPALGHALVEFAALSARQQTLLLWKALIGLGALELPEAALAVARALRDQGYLSALEIDAGGPVLTTITELLARAADAGSSFDRPEAGKIRAVQPDLEAYLLDDWFEIAIQALPEQEPIARRSALRRLYEHARDRWGLAGPEPRRGGRLSNVLESSLGSAIRRGLLVRVGAGSVQRLSALAAGAPAPAAEPRRAAGSLAEAGFLGGFSAALAALEPLPQLILARRAGWYGRPESVDSLATRLGLPIERVRQMESEAWLALGRDGVWVRRVRERAERALGPLSSLSLRLLLNDDAWWRGAERQLGLIAAVFENLLGGELHCVRLGRGRSEEAFLARFDQPQLDRARARLLELGARIQTPAPRSVYAALPAQVASELDPALAEYLRDELEAHLAVQSDAELDLPRVEPATVVRFIPPAPPESGADAPDQGSEARLRLEDIARSAFRTARTPLSFDGIAERVRQRIDVEDAELSSLLRLAPFVQRNADQYGLVLRDVPGGHDAIAGALTLVVAALEQSQRPLGVAEAFLLVQAESRALWSVELLRSLCASDPVLALTSADEVVLRRWQEGSSAAHSELCCPGLPPLARPRFEKLILDPPAEPERLLQRARSELGRLERLSSEDFIATSLARHLVELYERLLEQVAQGSARSQRLAQAAIGYFIGAGAEAEAGAESEDEDGGAIVDRDKLEETRAVLQAVLTQLELDWL